MIKQPFLRRSYVLVLFLALVEPNSYLLGDLCPSGQVPKSQFPSECPSPFFTVTQCLKTRKIIILLISI